MRASRVPYHQNVYDLLQIEPSECPEAARLIAAHEGQHGSLPASLREWYLVPNMVHPTDDCVIGTRCQTYSGDNWPLSLGHVLEAFHEASYTPARGWVSIIDETQGVSSWLVEVTGTDDPAVWSDDGPSNSPSDWIKVAPTFSAFMAGWIGKHYYRRWRYPSPDKPYAVHRNGLWLRSPDEPLQPPVIDFLIDQFGEPERTPRPGNVTTSTFKPPGGTVRVTADEPALTGGLSAWWIHADTPERLAEFATLLLPWGTLRDTLRADTDPAREVLRRVRGA